MALKVNQVNDIELPSRKTERAKFLRLFFKIKPESGYGKRHLALYEPGEKEVEVKSFVRLVHRSPNGTT